MIKILPMMAFDAIFQNESVQTESIFHRHNLICAIQNLKRKAGKHTRHCLKTVHCISKFKNESDVNQP